MDNYIVNDKPRMIVNSLFQNRRLKDKALIAFIYFVIITTKNLAAQ